MSVTTVVKTTIETVETITESKPSTIIIHPKPYHTFTCRHCHTKWSTNEWRKTKKGYSSDCPHCMYAAQCY